MKKIFFAALLISPGLAQLNAQVAPQDSLKNVVADTAAYSDDEEGLEESVSYSAKDSVVSIPGTGRAYLYGNATVEYGSMKMEAAVLEIDYSRNLIKAYGKIDTAGNGSGYPAFNDGSETIQADTIKYNLKTKKGKIYNAITKQGEFLVKGNEIKKDSNNVVYFKNMVCIPCDQKDAKTVFRATKAKVIPNDKIVSGPMYLEISGVPTPLGLPFGYFPNTKKKHNGILLPTPGYSQNQGFFLKQGGFYYGINDMTDMIIRGDAYTNGSWQLSVTNNYNVLYRASGHTLFSYSRFNIGDKDVPSAFRQEKAYQIGWVHMQDNKSNPLLNFSANVDVRHNQNFNRLNATNSGQFLQNTFQSNIKVTRLFDFGSLSVNGAHSQNSISGDMTITLPALTFNVNRFYPFKRKDAVKQNALDKIQMYYILEASNTLHTRDSTIFAGSPLDSLRYGFRHTLPVSTNFNILKYITATPALNFSSVMYTSSIRRELVAGENGSDVLRTREVKGFAAAYDANFSTAFNSQVYFDYVFSGRRLKQIRHLMIPTVTYLYRPDFGASQFGYWKQLRNDSSGVVYNYSIFDRGIYGGPSRGKQNSVILGLSNNVEAKVRHMSDTGATYKKVVLIQNLSVNTTYNAAADSFKLSNVAFTGRTTVLKYFDLVGAATFDPYRYSKVLHRRVDELTVLNGPPAAFTNGFLAVNTSIGSNMLASMRKVRQPLDLTNSSQPDAGGRSGSGGGLPWNLGVTYNLNLSKQREGRIQPQQTLNFSGNLTPTKFWTLRITSGLDFATQKITYTNVGVERDLKCWAATINWVPFGIQRQYYVAIRLKSAMLSDLQIPRRRQWFDNFQ